MRALFLSFHQRSSSSGGGIAARGFEQVSRLVLGSGMISVFQDDPPGAIEVDGLRVQVSRRSTASMAARLVVRGEMGRHHFRFSGNGRSQPPGGVAIVDGVGHAGVLPRLRRHFARTIIIHQNFEPDYYADTFHGHWRRGLMVRAGYRAEQRSARHADLNLFVTREDMNRFVAAFPGARGPSAVLGVFEPRAEFVPASRTQEGPLRVLITGTLGDRKGVVGLFELLEEARSRRHDLEGKVQFVVVGRRAPPAVRALSDGTLMCLIEDAPDIAPIARTCDIYLNPNFTGSGIKVRNLDGLRNGLPVVCRVENSAGFNDLPPESFRTIRSTDEALAILASSGLRERSCGDEVRRRVWQAYVDHFTIEAGVRLMRRALEQAGVSA